MAMESQELEREQMRSEHKLHLEGRVQESADPNLSLVTVAELEPMAFEVWGKFRAVCSFLDAHAADQQLSEEDGVEIARLFADCAKGVQSLARETDSQKEFVAFLNNMLTMEQAVTMTVKYDPEGWASMYQSLLRTITETYK